MDDALQFPAPRIPKAFALHDKIMQVLDATISEFGHEEQQALYFHHFLGLPLGDISLTTHLSENHVASTLGLYAARLNAKVELFKKAEPYNENDMLQIRDILLPWQNEVIPSKKRH